MDITKAFFDAWGIPGLQLVLVATGALWAFREVLKIQDQRIKDQQSFYEKYASLLLESNSVSKELTAVVNAALSRLK